MPEKASNYRKHFNACGSNTSHHRHVWADFSLVGEIDDKSAYLFLKSLFHEIFMFFHMNVDILKVTVFLYFLYAFYWS